MSYQTFMKLDFNGSVLYVEAENTLWEQPITEMLIRTYGTFQSDRPLSDQDCGTILIG